MSVAAEASIEQRLAAAEAAIAEIRQQLAPPAAGPDWLRKVSGIMKDKPGFQEMVAYGRAFREEHCPEDDATP